MLSLLKRGHLITFKKTQSGNDVFKYLYYKYIFLRRCAAAKPPTARPAVTASRKTVFDGAANRGEVAPHVLWLVAGMVILYFVKVEQ